MAISLSSGIRQSLASLQSVASQAQVSQQRLATGKKVNSAVDNAVNYFTAANLNTRADNFTDLLDGVSNSIQTIQAASTGIDGVTKLVKSLQSTIKQAQSDAATNKPTKTGTAIATTAEATATGGSLQDVALNKKLGVSGSSGAAAATSSSAPGTLGIDTSTNTSLAISLKSGNSTYQVALSADSTVRDLVNAVNKSGIATASVNSAGQLSITGSGSDTLKVGLGSGTSDSAAITDAASGTLNASIPGFATADATTGISSSANSSVRANLVSQFNDARDQLDQLAGDAGFNGTNLLNGDSLKTIFNEKTGSAQSKLTVQGSKITSSNLGIGQAGQTSGSAINFQDDNSLNVASQALTTALSTLQTLSSSLGSSLSTVQARQDFTKSLITTLQDGASNLVNADTNEEGAKLSALQTRQSLSTTALSLSSQADQAVLKLF